MKFTGKQPCRRFGFGL